MNIARISRYPNRSYARLSNLQSRTVLNKLKRSLRKHKRAQKAAERSQKTLLKRHKSHINPNNSGQEQLFLRREQFYSNSTRPQIREIPYNQPPDIQQRSMNLPQNFSHPSMSPTHEINHYHTHISDSSPSMDITEIIIEGGD